MVRDDSAGVKSCNPACRSTARVATRDPDVSRAARRARGPARPPARARGARAQPVVAAHGRAPAQELLHLALVAVAGLVAGPQAAHAQVLGERLHGLARRGSEPVSGGLQEPVVDPAPEAQLLQHLGRDPQARAARDGGGHARAPRRQDRREPLAEQRRDLREHQHAVAGGVVDSGQVVARGVLEHAGDVVLVDELVARVEAEDARHGREREQRDVARVDIGAERVGEPQHAHDDVRVAVRERPHGALGLDDVALDRRPRRMRPAHRLGEEGRVVALAAVVVGRRLEDHLAHGRAGPAAGGQDVHRPDHVVLVRLARRRGRRVDDQARVDHGVDRRRVHDPLEQGVLRSDADVLRALELARRVAGTHPDDHLDLRVALERLGEAPAPVGREAGDEDPAHPSHTELRCATMSITSSWIRARISSAMSCTSPLSSHGSAPSRSVGTGARKRSLNLAGR